MPGADAFADERGVFEIEIRLFNRPDVLPKHITWEGLEPGEPVSIEILKGEPR